jgi:transketolase
MHATDDLCKHLRATLLDMIYQAKSGHPGGSLSIVEICSVLFFELLQDFGKESKPHRNRFVLSKGHAVPTVYACLAKLGLIQPEELKTLRTLGSRLQGHPDCVRMPCLEAATGSLGQGLSIAQGIALGLQGSPAQVYCLIGDGEFQEGQVWEALLSAPKFKLSNLTVILDSNNGQIDGPVDQIMPIEPIAKKLDAFHWAVSTINGHSLPEIRAALTKKTDLKPHFVIAQTVKGKGISFMENNIGWHGVAPKKEELLNALAELGVTP